MGCFQSTAVNKDAAANNDRINKMLKEDKNKERREVKLLLLGTGESGKSTVLKQIRIIHGGGYSRPERLASRDVIFSNVVQSMKIILDALRKFEIQLGSPDDNAEHLKEIVNLRFQVESDVFPPSITAAIKALWADSGIQACFARSREYQLNDSAKYYFDSIDRIGAEGYIPTDEDILHSRVKTTGIIESTFQVEKQSYRIYDVGGQRSERRKWIHCFEGVTALFFIVAISEYDQKLVEDEHTNRVREAINLFSSISHNKWFENTSIILFLNKIDIFNNKVRVSPIENHFTEFTPIAGREPQEVGYDFFKALFEAEFDSKKSLLDNSANVGGSGAIRGNAAAGAGGAGAAGAGAGAGAAAAADSSNAAGNNAELLSKPKKELFVYPTCATDTAQMKHIISSVNQIIVQSNLESCGLI